MSDKKLYKITKTDTSVACEVSLEVEIKKEALEASKAKAIAAMSEHVHIDGFRPGHVPEKVLLEKVGEYAITEEACKQFIDDNFSEIVVESKHVPINQPQITVTKLAAGTDAEIKITFATPPVIELGNYKKIAKKHVDSRKDAEPATDAEIDAMIMDLRKQVAHMDHHAAHDDHDHNHGEIEPAELNDDFAKKVGPFETVADVKKAVAENISQSKSQREIETRRIGLIDEVIDDSKISYPSFFLTAEQGIIVEELKADLAKMGATLDSYLKQIGKTEAEFRDSKKDIADKRVKTQLVLSKIAVTEELKPDENVVESQVKEILQQHPTAMKENVQAFVERFELNQLVWKFLESGK